MSLYSNRMLSSDLDFYRSDGQVQTRSVVISGNVGAGSQATWTSSAFTLTDQDFQQIMFDNSVYHSGKWRDIHEETTFVLDTSSGSEFGVGFEPKINGNSLTIVCKLLNTTASTLTLQSTTINFRFVAYDSTLL